MAVLQEKKSAQAKRLMTSATPKSNKRLRAEVVVNPIARAHKAKLSATRNHFVELKNSGSSGMIKRVAAGLPVPIVDDAANYLNISKGDFISIVWLKPSSLSTWGKSASKALPLQESDRVARVARVTGMVEQMIGDREEAIAWLNRPIPALGMQKPLSLLGSDAGAKLVEDTLMRSLAGVYA